MDLDTMELENTIFLNELENLFVPDRGFPTYSPTERDTVLNHIEKYFGKSALMINDNDTNLMKIDIQITQPTMERPFYTVVTVGMGSMLMNVPRSIANGTLSRAELMITLPEDWKIGSNERRWKWPLAFMENIARIPLIENSWFSVGHIIPIRRSVAENTKLCGFVLLEPQESAIQSHKCLLQDGSEVNFYQLIPLYDEEIDYENRYGFEALMDRMSDVSHIVDVDRLNTCVETSAIVQ